MTMEAQVTNGKKLGKKPRPRSAELRSIRYQGQRWVLIEDIELSGWQITGMIERASTALKIVSRGRLSQDHVDKLWKAGYIRMAKLIDELDEYVKEYGRDWRAVAVDDPVIPSPDTGLTRWKETGQPVLVADLNGNPMLAHALPAVAQETGGTSVP